LGLSASAGGKPAVGGGPKEFSPLARVRLTIGVLPRDKPL